MWYYVFITFWNMHFKYLLIPLQIIQFDTFNPLKNVEFHAFSQAHFCFKVSFPGTKSLCGGLVTITSSGLGTHFPLAVFCVLSIFLSFLPTFLCKPAATRLAEQKYKEHCYRVKQIIGDGLSISDRLMWIWTKLK